MARKPKTTFAKRDKERARQQKQKDKEVRRVEAKRLKGDAAPRIAGIRPGPQPLPAQWHDETRRHLVATEEIPNDHL